MNPYTYKENRRPGRVGRVNPYNIADGVLLRVFIEMPCLPCLPFPQANYRAPHRVDKAGHNMHHENRFFEVGSGYIQTDERTPLVALIESEDIEAGELIDLDGIQGIPRDALKKLLMFLIPPSTRSSRVRWRKAQLRLATLARMLDVDNLSTLSLEELAGQLECTRSLLSQYSLAIVDSCGFNKPTLGKSRASRDVYRQAAIRSHAERGHAVKATL